MNRGIYATATGMLTAQQAMDVLTHNLANVSTNGYKRDGLAFNDALVRELNWNGQPIGSLGAGASPIEQYTSFEAGSINETRNPLDVAILGERGMFAVRTQGQIAYSRNGAFTLDPQRRLVTQEGHPVLDPQGRDIVLPEGQIAIATDGSILVDGEPQAQIGVFDAAGFTKRGSTLFNASGPATPVPAPTLKSGALEGSNVNAVEAMVQMIQLSRQFEMSQRSIVSQDELTQRLIQSLQDR